MSSNLTEVQQYEEIRAHFTAEVLLAAETPQILVSSGSSSTYLPRFRVCMSRTSTWYLGVRTGPFICYTRNLHIKNTAIMQNKQSDKTTMNSLYSVYNPIAEHQLISILHDKTGCCCFRGSIQSIRPQSLIYHLKNVSQERLFHVGQAVVQDMGHSFAPHCQPEESKHDQRSGQPMYRNTNLSGCTPPSTLGPEAAGWGSGSI